MRTSVCMHTQTHGVHTAVHDVCPLAPHNVSCKHTQPSHISGVTSHTTNLHKHTVSRGQCRPCARWLKSATRCTQLGSRRTRPVSRGLTFVDLGGYSFFIKYFVAVACGHRMPLFKRTTRTAPHTQMQVTAACSAPSATAGETCHCCAMTLSWPARPTAAAGSRHARARCVYMHVRQHARCMYFALAGRCFKTLRKHEYSGCCTRSLKRAHCVALHARRRCRLHRLPRTAAARFGAPSMVQRRAALTAGLATC